MLASSNNVVAVKNRTLGAYKVVFLQMRWITYNTINDYIVVYEQEGCRVQVCQPNTSPVKK